MSTAGRPDALARRIERLVVAAGADAGPDAVVEAVEALRASVEAGCDQLRTELSGLGDRVDDLAERVRGLEAAVAGLRRDRARAADGATVVPGPGRTAGSAGSASRPGRTVAAPGRRPS